MDNTERIDAIMKDQDPKWVVNKDEKIPNEDGDYELTVFLSTDFKHTVSVKVTNPHSRYIAVKKATEMFDYLINKYGTKQEKSKQTYQQEQQSFNPDKTKQDTCEHPKMKFATVKKEGPNQGRDFRTCAVCNKFLGFVS